MKKVIAILILGIVYNNLINAQISVYYSEKEDVYGYSISAINQAWSRDNNAEAECRSKGGKNARQILSRDGYGCYAIVKGSDKNGGYFIGAAAGDFSVEIAIQNAKWYAKSRGADDNSIYVVHQGCINKPSTSSNNQTTQNSNALKNAKWSDWKKINSSSCDLGIEYRSKREERLQLNYQLWFYYEVRNVSNKNISFEFNLTRNGKVEFSKSHFLSPNGNDEFMHKMESNYIDGVSVTKVLNTETKRSVCDDAQNGNSNNSNSSNMQELLNKWNSLCSRADNSQNPAVINAKNRSCLKEAKNFEDNAGNRTMIQNKIKDLENAFATDQNFEKTELDKKAQQDAVKKAEEERLQAQSKVWVQKTSNFTNLINEGDQALNNGQYDAAIAKYNEAKNLYTGDIAPQEQAYAKDAIPMADARIAAAQKAKSDAARKVRVAEKQRVEQQQNDATIAAAASFAGIMALVKDAYSPHWFAAKFQVGLGYGSTPIISNSAFNQKSITKNSNQFQFRLGLKLGFANNKGISIHLNPLYDFGVNALQKGIDGSSSSYGGTATLFLGKKSTSKIKLFAEGGYIKTSGKYNYDQAVAEGQNSTSDNVEEATYNYSVLKYGGGIMLHFIKYGKETFIKPGVFLEKPSFAQSSDKPVMVGNLQINIASTIIFDISYSKSYLIGGNLSYPYNFVKDNKNYWNIKIIRQGKLK